MANKSVYIVQSGTNNYLIPALGFNKLATDIVTPGVVGAIFNTSGVAPATGSFAVNAQGSPNMTVAVSAGSAYVNATPTSGTAQKVAVSMDASENVTIAANATGSTRYDFVYIYVDPDKMNNPAVDGLDAVTLITQRSTTQTVDSNGAPANATLIAEVTVANGASSIANASIADRRLICNDDIDGWKNANETWTYASATTITVPAGAAFKYSIGDKIRFIQSGSTKYMYVTGVASTLLTVSGGTDYTVANAAIGSPCYSKHVDPVGFPTWFNYTPAFVNLSVGNGTLTAAFKLTGKAVQFYSLLIWGSTTSISGNVEYTLPLTSISYPGSVNTFPVGQVVCLDSGVATYAGVATWNTTTTVKLRPGVASTANLTLAGAVTSTVPFTWGTADEMHVTGEYRIA